MEIKNEQLQRIIQSALIEIANKSNPTAVDVTAKVKRKYYY